MDQDENVVLTGDLLSKQEFGSLKCLRSLHHAIRQIFLNPGNSVCPQRRQSLLRLDKRSGQSVSAQFPSAQPQFTAWQSLILLRPAENLYQRGRLLLTLNHL
jgi:hypothetical protein